MIQEVKQFMKYLKNYVVLVQKKVVFQLHCTTEEQYVEYLSNGLSSIQAEQLLEVYGRNEIKEIPPPSYYELIKEQFENRSVRILVGVEEISSPLIVNVVV
jgi:magnesium-transporting ATPase (P-type)